MSNYAETKKTLDIIKSSYSCAGDLIFRTAIQYVVELGTSNLLDDWTYEHLKGDINERHDVAEAEGKLLFISRNFELAIIECAREIAQVNIYDLLMYIQQEVWLGGDGISYKRALEIIGSCLMFAAENDCCNNEERLNWFQCNFDLTDEEIEELGFGWVFEKEEE